MGTIPQLEDCNPGLRPVEYNVIIAPEVVETVTKGGIIIADITKDADQLAQVRGLLVDVSPLAFNFDTWPDSAAEMRPKAGDHVLFAKYAAGIEFKGDDGRTYKLVSDKSIAAVITVPQSATLKAVA
jgi:co-chaperonin GroES (HSP10)